jgi:hypothetical protein
MSVSDGGWKKRGVKIPGRECPGIKQATLLHHTAFIGATPADVCALLAVGIGKHIAVCGAGIADLLTEGAQFLYVGGVNRHKGNGLLADQRAFLQAFNAVFPLGHIGLLDAGVQALVTGLGAVCARVDAFLVFVCGTGDDTHRITPFT